MQIASALNQTQYELFRWRYQASLPWKITLSLAMAGLIGLMAQVRLPLPFTPVPLTGQTLAALLAGILLGKRWGGISLACYAILGIAGVPWFNGWSNGLSATTGYIVGFILAALFLGYFNDKYVRVRRFSSMFGMMLFASLVLIYVPGLVWLGLWLNLVKGTTVSVAAILGMGAVPFIAGDILKAAIAAAIAIAVTPKVAYDEADATVDGISHSL